MVVLPTALIWRHLSLSLSLSLCLSVRSHNGTTVRRNTVIGGLEKDLVGYAAKFHIS